MGYHKRKISKGKFGEFSKIKEEFMELVDSHEQGVKIMELTEFSDLYGAIEAYIQKHFNMSVDDLRLMNERTAEAFKDGSRTEKESVEHDSE